MCIDADEVLLARCVAKWDGSYGNRHDALLMRAAPDLLEACKQAFEILGTSRASTFEALNHDCARAMKLLEAARRKAEQP
jgi:hypothetical protein